jgi:uncharacterized membrane protein
MRRLAGLAAVLLAFLFMACPAQAALKLCNRTSYILTSATATISGPQVSAQGWTRIVPGDCQIALTQPLGPQGPLVYARSALAHSGPQHAWGGTLPLCVKDGNFSLRQPGSARACASDDSFQVPFAPVDTHGQRDWTMTFDEQPALPSLEAAQLAGVKRLLSDNGYKVGSITGGPDKRTAVSLAAFRKTISPQADNAQLFQALEHQALLRAAPAGYTVCNDTNSTLLVAIGEVTKNAVQSRGWWHVAGGACGRLLTMPLAADAVFLAAQTLTGSVIVNGPDRFCVTGTAFAIQQRDNCVERGYRETGFARTMTKSMAGYVAHIGANGLAVHQTGISK